MNNADVVAKLEVLNDTSNMNPDQIETWRQQVFAALEEAKTEGYNQGFQDGVSHNLRMQTRRQ